MASFFSESYKTIWESSEICAHIDGLDARGGATLTAVGNTIVLFGGADRGQCSFGDLWVYSNDDPYEWRKVECSGDTPTPRSGHAVTSVDNIMFLFGGIDFGEEAVYNDLYILNTDSWEWSYVGEAGEEVPARNSHSLAVVTGSTSGPASGSTNGRYLVVYGGASPELGPLGDTYYAELPDSLSEVSNLFVTWKALSHCSVGADAAETRVGIDTIVEPSVQSGVGVEVGSGAGPGNREMHCTCASRGRMYINGGRNAAGEVLSDTWELSVASAVPSSSTRLPCITSPDTHSPSSAPLLWRHLPDLTLPTPRCSHGGAILTRSTGTSRGGGSGSSGQGMEVDSDSRTSSALGEEHDLFCVFGGFCGDVGVSGELSVTHMESPALNTLGSVGDVVGSAFAETSPRWTTIQLSRPVPERFGLSMCTAPIWLTSSSFITKYVSRKKSLIATSSNSKSGSAVALPETRLSDESNRVGIVMFGGINIATDYNDFWLISPPSF